MTYYAIWLGGLIGALLGVTAFRIVANRFKWPLIVAVSIAVITVCVCFLLGYWVESATNPYFTGL